MIPAINLEGAVVYKNNCLDILREMPDNSIDSIVTDPPYGLSDNKFVADTIEKWILGKRDFIPDGKGFMGKSWDAFVPPPAVWDECLRVLKPGGHLLAFFGTRTQDIGTLAIRLAGFEVRDSIAWMYGSGFPKSLDISKAIDKAMGIDPKRIIKRWNDDEDYVWSETVTALETYGIDKYLADNGYHKTIDYILPNWKEYVVLVFAADEGVVVGLKEGWENNAYGGGNAKCSKCGKWFISGSPCVCPKSETKPITAEAQQWQGWGTALKPAFEPIIVARKPIEGTVAANVLKWGTGGLNISGSRIGNETITTTNGKGFAGSFEGGTNNNGGNSHQGRWPANLILDETAAAMLDEQADASRFFYIAKASKRDRNEGLDELEIKRPDTRTEVSMGTFEQKGVQPQRNHHPTVKPTALMEYLIKLVTPPGGIVLDPFTGSGSTGKAALLNGFQFVGIEMTEEYFPIIEGRLRFAIDSAKADRTLF